MVWAYLKIEKKINHPKAYIKYPSKRMVLGNPNGNIIVDANGDYNFLDQNAHKDRFKEIKEYYVIGCQKKSKILSSNEIVNKSKAFHTLLQNIFKTTNKSVSEIVGRKGRVLNKQQVHTILNLL